MIAPSFHQRCLLMTALAWFATCGLTGCLSRTTFTTFANKVKHETVNLDYYIRNAKPELDPWSSFSDSPLVSASWDGDGDGQSETAPDPSAFSAGLNIEFPHPHQGTDHALATLTIYERPLPEKTFQPERRVPWHKRILPSGLRPSDEKPQQVPQEILTLDISRSQFDLLMSDLRREHYLNDSAQGKHSLPTRGEASLLVKRNDKPVHRSLVTDARLNEFVRKIYQEGEIVLGKREDSPSIIRTTAVFEAPHPWYE
jgi:hypothetical protein